MLTLPQLIVAKYEGQKLYHHDIVSVYHTVMKQDIYYIVHYRMEDQKFYLVPISGASFPTLPLDYLKDGEWEWYGQPDNDLPPISMPGPEDTFIGNLALYLQRHY